MTSYNDDFHDLLFNPNVTTGNVYLSDFEYFRRRNISLRNVMGPLSVCGKTSGSGRSEIGQVDARLPGSCISLAMQLSLN